MKRTTTHKGKWNKVLLKHLWRVLSIAAVIFWGMLIFGFSEQEAEESSKISKNVCYTIADEYNTIFKQQLTENELWEIVKKIEHPTRKAAHMSEYAILALLFYNLLYSFGMRGIKNFFTVLLIAFAYALTDEFHQLFVEGRAGQFSDVFIDTLGALLMLLLIAFAIFLSKRRKRRKRSRTKTCG